MKPYNVEIFDRHFAYRASLLMDSAEFHYNYDSFANEKNSFSVKKGMITVREFAESGSEGDGSIACSDYIRFTTDNKEYAGTIIEIEENGDSYTITHSPIYKLLDHEVLVATDDIKTTTIEAYIKQLLEDEFVNSEDEFQIIDGLTVTTSGATKGTFDFNDSSDIYAVINLLTDLIYPAFREYLIYTDLSIDFSTKSVDVSIREIDLNEIIVESDLPNIIDKSALIRKTSDEKNKMTLYDTADYSLTAYNYYLHPSDYSFNQINDREDRFYPVVNAVYQFDSDAITEEEYFFIANQNARTLSKYAEIDRVLTPNEHELLDEAASQLIPFVRKSKTDDEWEEYSRAAAIEYVQYIIRNGLNWDGTGTAGGGTFVYESWEDMVEGAQNSHAVAINERAITIQSVDYYIEDSKPSTPTESDYIDLPSEGQHISQYAPNGEIIWRTHFPDGTVDRNGYKYFPTGYKYFPSSFVRDKEIQIKSITGMAQPRYFNAWVQASSVETVYSDPDNWAGGGKKFCQGTLVDKSSHIYMRFHYTCAIGVTDGDPYEPDIGTMSFFYNVPVDKSYLSSVFEQYRQTEEFKREYAEYKAANFASILDGYAKRLFKTSKYKNLIELTVKADDPMINPLTMPIGQVVNIIHEGVSYNSILTGREVKGGLVKLIFGTIRLELTKILNMKGV